MTTENKAPREWRLIDPIDNDATHVIEHSAYLDLQMQLDEAKDKLNRTEAQNIRLREMAELEIVKELRAELAEAKATNLETVKRIYRRVVGYQASNNVFRILNEEISKLDPTHRPESARKRRQRIVERNDLVENLKTENKRLREALKSAGAFNEYMLKHYMSLNPNWRETKYAAEHFKQSHKIDEALKGEG